MRYFFIISIALVGSPFSNYLTAQTATTDNKPAQTITFRAIPKGPYVIGVFEGRPPCSGLLPQLGLVADNGCVKLKCELALYRDSVTLHPSSYTLTVVGAGEVIKQQGGQYRLGKLAGSLTVIKGSPLNAHAEIYKLDVDKAGACLYLLKGDDNVLFVLDKNKQLIPGNEDFSYTLNRVELVAGKQ